MYSPFDIRGTDPDQIRSFKFIKKVGRLRLYELSETRTQIQIGHITVCPTTSQVALRKMMNEQLGKKRNPWCFLQNMCGNHWNIGNFSIDAIYWWNIYSAEPKIVAFKGILPYGFRAVSIYDKNIFKKQNGYDEVKFKEHLDDFYRMCLPWQDRFNNPYAFLDDEGTFHD